jgi:hypothetical protein
VTRIPLFLYRASHLLYNECVGLNSSSNVSWKYLDKGRQVLPPLEVYTRMCIFSIRYSTVDVFMIFFSLKSKSEITPKATSYLSCVSSVGSEARKED